MANHVYIAGSLRNRDRIIEVSLGFNRAGFETFSNWSATHPDTDDYWRDYHQAHGRNMIEALKQPDSLNTFYFDERNIRASRAFVLVTPAGKSGHLELGFALGRNIPGYILMEDPNPERWDVMYSFANGVFEHTGDLIAEVDKRLNTPAPFSA